MANDKLLWADLRKEIARTANASNSEVNVFMNALCEVILETLKTEKQVKIKGIGTFSLKVVAPRESINISTGERFTIGGYNKLVFNAEAALKESVSKRIATSDAAIPDTPENVSPIQKLSNQADEIVDLLADLGQAPGSNATKKEETKKPIEVAVEKQAETTEAETTEAQSPKKECKPWWWIIIIVLAIGAGYYFRQDIIGWYNTHFAKAEAIYNTELSTAPIDSIVEEEALSISASVPLSEQERVYTEFIGEEYVNKGSRLTWISYKYYGVKDLWVFIYEANKKLIKDPNHLEYQQVIHIPLLDEKWMDLSNPEVRALIKELEEKYLHKIE